MTNAEKALLCEEYSLVAAVFGREASTKVVALMVESLSDLPFDQVRAALRVSVSRFKFFPLPKEIRELVRPDVSDGDAREAAARVVQAISRFGHTNSAQARIFIGELGQYLVERMGGWGKVCAMTSEELTHSAAQWRELVKHAIFRARNGTLEQPPNFPKPETTMLANIGGVAAQLTNSMGLK